MKEIDPIVFENMSAYLPKAKAAVVIEDTRNIFAKPDAEPITVAFKDTTLQRVVPWGENNDIPQKIIERAAKVSDLSTGMLFNIQVGYGEGIIACRYEVDANGKKKVIPVFDNEEINEFFDVNDINGYLLEQMTDMNFFYNVFPEIILDQEVPDKRKIVSLTHKEAAFSRWEEMDKATGLIKHHFYSAEWAEASSPDPDKITVTEVLNHRQPVQDLLVRMGRQKSPGAKGTKDDKVYRYIVPVSFPSPGRTYYQKPYWYSIIESGWIDFAEAIPQFKKYLLQNGMTIKYIIRLSDKYFPEIFAREGITEVDKQKARVKKEYADLNKYVTGISNSGKSMVTYFKEGQDGKPLPKIIIEAINNEFKGGEYLKDSGEVSNMIAYTLGVHPSLIGASPGSTSNLSGTDKRELFIIKQALLKPIRDRILRPLYLIKAINKWPMDIHFAIPNIELTTLDKNSTGTETKIA